MRYDPVDKEIAALERLSGGFAGKRVLEVGCGSGRITRKFASKAAHVDAIDPNEDKIEKALGWKGETAVQLHYHAQSLEMFVASEAYDLIILSWSL